MQREVLSELQQRNIEERKRLESAVADGEALLAQVRAALRTIVESHYRLVTEDTEAATTGCCADAVAVDSATNGAGNLPSGAPPTALGSDGDSTAGVRMNVDGTGARALRAAAVGLPAAGDEAVSIDARGVKRPRIDK